MLELNFYKNEDDDLGDDWALYGYPAIRLCGEGVEEILEVEDDAYELTILIYGVEDLSAPDDAFRCCLRPSEIFPSVFMEIDREEGLFQEVGLTASVFRFLEPLGPEFYADVYFQTGEPEPWEGVDRDY
jgi:hypothetical protein